MTDTEQVEVPTVIVPGINPFLDSKDPLDKDVKCLITNIGYKKGAKTKYEVFAPIPTTDAEAQRFYKCDLVYLIEKGTRAFTTSVQFAPFFLGKEKLTPEQHAKLQKAMNDYQVGNRGTGSSVKKKAEATDELMVLWGCSTVEELKVKVAEMKKAAAAAEAAKPAKK